MSIHLRLSRTLPSFRLSPCTAALLLALGGGALPLPSIAQTATTPAAPAAGAEATRDYDLPAGPLAATLNRIAREAGLALTVDAQLVEGRSAAPVQGRLNAAQALRQALAGSGLELLAATGGGYTLRPVAQTSPASTSSGGGEATLAQVTVTAQTVREGVTEGSGSYQASYTNTATRLNLSPRETPQTITVVTHQQMDDFGMTSVDDALKATSGVYLIEQGSNGNVYYSRGFELQSQYDGMAAPGGISDWNRAPQADRAFLDRVEVLQGAAGLLSGAGEPGGSINLVRKRPTESFQGQAEVQLGSWNQHRMVADVSGPLVASGRIRGRLVAVADDSDSFTDHVFLDRRAVYGIVEADLTPGTLFSASVQHQRDEGRNQFGVPFAADGSDAGLRRSLFLADANHRVNKDATQYTLGLTQRLSGGWSLKAAYSSQETGNVIRNYSFITGSLNPVTGDGMLMRRMRAFARDTRSHALDVHATGPFDLLGRKHELALGTNGTSYRDTFQGSGYYPVSTAINVHTFDPASLGPVPDGGIPYLGSTRVDQLGLYGVARWSLADSFKLITGARVSQYRSKDLVTGVTDIKESGVVSPYAGLVYDLDAQYSVYASYSDIFNPQSNRSANGSMLDPVVGANYELGIKGELMDKRLNVSAAVFRLEQTNLAREDDSVPFDPTNACGGTCYIAADKVVSQGVDLGISGQLGRDLNLSAGYTYMSAEYAAGDLQGQRYLTDAPRHSLRLAAIYSLPGTGWSVGGHLAATSRAHKINRSATNPWTIHRGSLLLLGLTAKYRINPKTEALFSISNLTDRSYRNLEGRNYSTFGEPRKFTANLKYRF